MDMGRGEERVKCMERVTCKVTLPYVKYGQATGICCMSQKTKTGTLYQPRGVGWGGRWEGGSKGRGQVPVCRVMRKQSALKELTLTPLVQQHLISQEL